MLRWLKRVFTFQCCYRNILLDEIDESSQILPHTTISNEIYEKCELIFYGQFPVSMLKSPFNLREFSSLRSFKVKKMAFGKEHGLILFHDCGQLIGVFGNNENGQLGIKLKDKEDVLNDDHFNLASDKEIPDEGGHNHEEENIQLNPYNNVNYYDSLCLNPVTLGKQFGINLFDIIDISCADNFSLILIKDSLNKIHLFKFYVSEEDKISYHSKQGKPKNNKNLSKETEKHHHDDFKVVHKEPIFEWKVKKIYASNERVMLLTDDNSIYCKGLGFNMAILDKFKPVVEKFEHGKIIDINLGVRFMLLLTENSELYAMGDNDYGELGIENMKCTNIPVKIVFFENYFKEKMIKKTAKIAEEEDDKYPDLETKKEPKIEGDKNNITEKPPTEVKIKKVCTGSRHSLILTSNNKVYCFGDNSEGQCSGFTNFYNKPTKVRFLGKQRIVDIAAGENHSLALSEKGELFSWGDTSFGKLGYHDGQTNQKTAKAVPFIQGRNISQIIAGPQQSVVITSSSGDSLIKQV